MTNLRFVVGLALVVTLLAASVILMRPRPQPKAPRPAAAAGDAAALTRAAELMLRSGSLPAPARIPDSPAPVAAAPAPKPGGRLNAQGVPVTSVSMQNQIRNNLRTLVVARNMFLKEKGRLPASFDELVGPAGSVPALNAVNGEVYTGIDLGVARLAVTAADGIEVVLENAAPRPYGPPTPQETLQWEAELATYASASLTKVPEDGAVTEHRAALLAVAEVMKREGWDAGVKVFRPERMGDAWFVQLNHLGQREENGKRVAWGQYASMYLNDQGGVSRYELGKVRVAPLE